MNFVNRPLMRAGAVSVAILLLMSACSAPSGDTDGERSTADQSSDVEQFGARSTLMGAQELMSVEELARQVEIDMNDVVAAARATLKVNRTWTNPHNQDLCETFSAMVEGVEDIPSTSVEAIAMACNDVARTIILDDSVTYDVVKTDSIISPFRAEMSIGYAVSWMHVDTSGDHVVDAGDEQLNFGTFNLTWRYIDNAWQLSNVTSSPSGYTELARALFLKGEIPLVGSLSTAPPAEG